MISAIHPAPSPTTGTDAWVRANAPTFTGQVKLDVGTAAVPSVSGPVGTSGLYVTATPTVGIAVGGVSAVLVNAALAAYFAGELQFGHPMVKIGKDANGGQPYFGNNVHSPSSTAYTHGVTGQAYGFGTLNGLVFYAADSAAAGTALAQRMRLTGAGLIVGAGTIAAGARFNVATTGSANALVIADSTGNSGFGGASSSTRRVYVQESVAANVALAALHIGTAAYVPVLELMAPNLTAGQIVYLDFGKAQTENNRSYLAFHWAGAGDATNSLRIGFWGSEPFKFHANGSMSIGATTTNLTCLLDLVSATKGLGLPSSATAAFSATRAGVMRWDTTLSKITVWNGAAWETVTSA